MVSGSNGSFVDGHVGRGSIRVEPPFFYKYSIIYTAVYSLC